MLRTLEAFEHLPVNVGLQPSARTGIPGQLEVRSRPAPSA